MVLFLCQGALWEISFFRVTKVTGGSRLVTRRWTSDTHPPLFRMMVVACRRFAQQLVERAVVQRT
jgi:hypothetical protein